MVLTAAGVSHRTAALDVRDRLTFRAQEQASALQRIKSLSGATVKGSPGMFQYPFGARK